MLTSAVSTQYDRLLSWQWCMSVCLWRLVHCG